MRYWMSRFPMGLNKAPSMCYVSHPLYLVFPVVPSLALQKCMLCPFFLKNIISRAMFFFFPMPFVSSSLFFLYFIHFVILLFMCSAYYFVSSLFVLGMVLLESRKHFLRAWRVASQQTDFRAHVGLVFSLWSDLCAVHSHKLMFQACRQVNLQCRPTGGKEGLFLPNLVSQTLFESVSLYNVDKRDHISSNRVFP